MGWLADVAEVFVGTRCASCDNAALALCPECLREIRPRPAIVRADPCRVAASGDYDAVLRAAIIAWKERGRFTVERPLAQLLAAAVLVLEVETPVTLVPVPSRPDRRRARGGDVVADLARCSARVLRGLGADVTVLPSLTLVRRVRDQAGLSAADRAANLQGAMKVRRVPRQPVVVVDDIVTTGATVTEAVRVLRGAGATVAGAAVVAHRPHR